MDREFEKASFAATMQVDKIVRDYIKRYFNGELNSYYGSNNRLDSFSVVNRNMNFISTIGEQDDIPQEIKDLLGKFKLTEEEANKYVDIVRDFNKLCEMNGRDSVDESIYDRAYEAKTKLYQSTYLTIIREINKFRNRPSLLSQNDIFDSAILVIGYIIDNKYDSQRSPFNAYVSTMINKIVSKIVDTQSNVVNVPQYFAQDERKVYKSEELLSENKITKEEIGEKFNLTEKDIENVKKRGIKYVDLDDKLSSDDEDDKTYSDIIVSGFLSPEEEDELESNRKQASKMLEMVLKPKQVEIVKEFSYLFNEFIPTFDEVCEKFGYKNGDSLGVTYRRLIGTLKDSKYSRRLEEVGFRLESKYAKSIHE